MTCDRDFTPESIDRWFPRKRQKDYVLLLMKPTRRPVGLTRCRAEYFVRLWAYLLLKQRFAAGEKPQHPLAELQIPQGFVPCTHREAAQVFYAQRERGSERSAGMLLDKLVALGLLDKIFDGNTICLQVNPQPNLTQPEEPALPLQFKPDHFDPRGDAILVANFLAQNYNWMNNSSTAVPHHIARLLRRWVRQYPRGMRVLRRCDNFTPVGFALFYPTAPESEPNFFLPPSKSLHLSDPKPEDPLVMAEVGDLDCTSIFVRSWTIDRPYMQGPQICQLLEDSQGILKLMQDDFPNACDLYALIIHPILEKLATAVGFQKTTPDPALGIYWVYQSIDRFLALDIKQALIDADLFAGDR